MEEGFNITWDDGPNTVGQLEMCEEVVVQDIGTDGIVVEETTAEDVLYMQSGEATGNVVYMHNDQVLVDQNEQIISDEGFIECQVAEEVISDDWVQPQADERVEIVGDYTANQIEGNNSDDIEIPLPTDQDEYTTSRPYPCDFCSRRFRKKANLMNHMVAHQTDRPHGCNLCGARYIRKCDLMNHLKIHAYVPEPEAYEDDNGVDDDLHYQIESDSRPRKKKNSSKKKKNNKIKVKQEEEPYVEEEKYSVPSRSYDYVDEDMRLLTEMANSSARTLEYDSAEYADMLPPENHPISEPRYPITDPRKPFVCQHCGVGFAREKALASHARIHGGDSPFECETCNDMFWDIGLLKEHVRNKHGNTTDHLGYDNDDDEDYVEEEERYGDYFCQTCGMTFHRQDLLRRHTRIHVKEEYVNESEFGHVCNVCGDSFPEALDLLAHAEVHARLDIHRCMLCGESFSEEQAMANHIAQRHAKNMPLNSCMLCGKTCKDRRALLKHSWEHSKEKSFSCSKCGKSFHNKARLRRHNLSHRNKSVSCNVCGEDFPDGRSLMNHRHSHTNMSGRQFPCRECGKTFGSRSSQQIHIRIHTGERPYGCRFCWKAFADGGTLRKHERIHTGEKPYACAVCPRAFNQRVVLREHIRSHHSGPDPKYGTTMTPYCCSVCNDLFSTSQDLIVHLIHHCDLNTAMKRQPQVGPRKYKRRRKLKPHELERLSNRLDRDEPSALPPDELLSDSDDNTKRKLGRKNKRQKPVVPPPQIEDNYESVFQSFESAVQTINNIVNPTKSTRGRKKKVTNNTDVPQTSVPSRPKMIHTQKTRVAVEVSTSDGSKVRHKTKTLITRTTPSAVNNINDKISQAIQDKNNERNRPRTKNVSYHVQHPEKYPTATFEEMKMETVDEIIPMKMEQNVIVKSEPENRRENFMDLDEMFYHMNNYGDEEQHALGLENNFQVAQNIEVSEEIVPEVENEEVYIGENVDDQQIEDDNDDVVHEEITGDPLTTSSLHFVQVNNNYNRLENGDYASESVLPETLDEQQHMQEIHDIHHHHHHHQQRHQVNVKLEPLENTSLYELAELSMQHAQNKFKCEMCSATFSDHGKLKSHVQVHI